MNEQAFYVEPPMTFRNFLPRIWHHIVNGSSPYLTSPGSIAINFGLDFDSHPGPIDEVICNAKENHKSVFLFIFSKNNPFCSQFVEILRQPQISEIFRDNFVFYPVDIAYPDGWRLANYFKFTQVPVFSIIRPQGSTFGESHVFLKHQGEITEEDLRSYIAMEVNANQNIREEPNNTEDNHNEENPPINDNIENQLDPSPIPDTQNIETDDGNLTSSNNDVMQEQINQEFDNLPQINDETKCFTVRFIFPNDSPKTHKFPIDGNIHMFFIFVRKFLFPKSFTLFTGFPQQEITDSMQNLSDIFSDSQFIVYVQQSE